MRRHLTHAGGEAMRNGTACRNTLQGPHAAADEEGYVCSLDALTPMGCCKHSSQRVQVRLLDTLGKQNKQSWETRSARLCVVSPTHPHLGVDAATALNFHVASMGGESVSTTAPANICHYISCNGTGLAICHLLSHDHRFPDHFHLTSTTAIRVARTTAAHALSIVWRAASVQRTLPSGDRCL